MLRKNKGFLEGVNLVESQIIFNDSHEDQKHRRKPAEQPSVGELTNRKSYNYQTDRDFQLLTAPVSREINLALPLKGRQSIIDLVPATFTHRTQLNRNPKPRIAAEAMKETLRSADGSPLGASLRQGEKEFLNDYHRKGTASLYNVFQQEETLLQKLPKCQSCSTNLQNIIKTYVCLTKDCQRNDEFVCPGCKARGHHATHTIFPAFSILYYFQKQANDPAEIDRLEQLSSLIKEIDNSIKELHAEIERLEHMRSSLKERDIRCHKQQEDGSHRTVGRQLHKLLGHIEDCTEYEFQSELNRLLLQANIDKVLSVRLYQEPKSTFFPKLNEMMANIPQPFLPHDQHVSQPLLLEAMAPLKNYFIGEEVQLTTSTHINVRELGKVKIVCDGQTHCVIDKVREAVVSFKGRRMDRQIRKIIEELQRWSVRRNRFKGFEFTFDYKLNAHPTTEHSPMLSELMRVPTTALRINLSNIKNNETIRTEFAQVFNTFRQVKELHLSISLNHLHSQAPIFLDRPENIILFAQSLGHRLLKLTLKVPLHIAEEHQQPFLRELIGKPHLLSTVLKFDNPFSPTNQLLYQQLLRCCRLRTLTTYKLQLLSPLLKKFGNSHHYLLQLLLS